MVFVNITGRVKDYYADEINELVEDADDWCDEPPGWDDDAIPVNLYGEVDDDAV